MEKAVAYANSPYATVTIEALNSYTEAMEPLADTYTNDYKAGDVIKLKFTPKSEYQFIKWIADPEGAVVFEDEKNPVTTATIVTAGELKIAPQCMENFYAVTGTPGIADGSVNRTTEICIYFNAPVDIKSIYWTEEEIEEKAKESGYTKQNGEWKNGNNCLLYKEYEVSGNANTYWKYITRDSSEKKVKDESFFKNICINDAQGNSLLSYYAMPVLQDDGTKLVIPVVKTDSVYKLPANKLIKYKISGLVSEQGVTQNKEFSSEYLTNIIYDTTGPVLSVLYNNGLDKMFHDIRNGGINNYIWQLGASVISEDEISKTGESDLYDKGIKSLKKIYIYDSFYITDESELKGFVVTLTPIKNIVYPSQELTDVIEIEFPISKRVGFNALTAVQTQVIFDLSDLEIEGLFKISISVADVFGNSTTFITKNPMYAIIDNIFNEELLKYEFTAYGSLQITQGPVGYYKCVRSEKQINTEEEARELFTDPNSSDYGIINIYPMSITGNGNYLYLLVEDSYGNFFWKELSL